MHFAIVVLQNSVSALKLSENRPYDHYYRHIMPYLQYIWSKLNRGSLGTPVNMDE